MQKKHRKIRLRQYELLGKFVMEGSNQSAYDREFMSLSSGTRISYLSISLRPVWLKQGDPLTPKFHLKN